MKKILIGLCAAPLLWSGASVAQDSEAPNLTAVEIFMCDYNKGKGPKDLAKVVDKFNAWSEENNAVPYTAWTLDPVFNNPGYSFDLGWLGAWKNGADMGKGIQQWKDGGGAVQAEFDKVIACSQHSLFNAANFKPQAGADWPPTGVTVFSDCSLAEGKTLDDALEVHQKWTAHLNERGSKAGMWAFFPAMGGDNSGFDYKIVMSHPDYVSFGADNNDYTNGAGWRKAQEMSGVVSCDTPRAYDSTLRRDGGVNVN